MDSGDNFLILENLSNKILKEDIEKFFEDCIFIYF